MTQRELILRNGPEIEKTVHLVWAAVQSALSPLARGSNGALSVNGDWTHVWDL